MMQPLWRKSLVLSKTTYIVVVVIQSLSHVRLCFAVNCSTPGFPVLHHLPEFAQIHVHWIGDAIQPSYPLPPSSPFAFDLSQHQGFFPMSWLFPSGFSGVFWFVFLFYSTKRQQKRLCIYKQSISLWGVHWREIKTDIHSKTCTSMFIAADA